MCSSGRRFFLFFWRQILSRGGSLLPVRAASGPDAGSVIRKGRIFKSGRSVTFLLARFEKNEQAQEVDDHTDTGNQSARSPGGGRCKFCSRYTMVCPRQMHVLCATQQGTYSIFSAHMVDCARFLACLVHALLRYPAQQSTASGKWRV